MKIAPYYKNVLQKAHDLISKIEPASFVGMYDGGQDYLYNLLISNINQRKKENTLFVVADLTGTNGLPADELKAVISGLSLIFKKDGSQIKSFEELFIYLSKSLKSQTVIFIINVDASGKISLELLQLISRLRTAFTWNFAYLIFAYTNILGQKLISENSLGKVITRQIFPILPLNEQNAAEVMMINEDRYHQKVGSKTKRAIMKLAGGNPGLLKSLYLQAITTKNWCQPNLTDSDLHFRLSKITAVLSAELLQVMKQILKGKKESSEKLIFLKRYGYLTKSGEIFSPLWEDFLKQVFSQSISSQEEQMNLLLTPFQRAALQLFQERQGKIVSREELAHAVWKDAWSERYSDWAIDQLMHELRDKLEQLKLGKVKTKKKEGFIYQEWRD